MLRNTGTNIPNSFTTERESIQEIMKFLPPAPGKALIDRKGDNGGLGVVGEKGVDVTPQAKRRTIVKIKGTGEKRGRSTSPHGGPVLKYNDLKRMQHRFENASVAIESILAKKDGQGGGGGPGQRRCSGDFAEDCQSAQCMEGRRGEASPSGGLSHRQVQEAAGP